MMHHKFSFLIFVCTITGFAGCRTAETTSSLNANGEPLTTEAIEEYQFQAMRCGARALFLKMGDSGNRLERTAACFYGLGISISDTISTLKSCASLINGDDVVTMTNFNACLVASAGAKNIAGDVQALLSKGKCNPANLDGSFSTGFMPLDNLIGKFPLITSLAFCAKTVYSGAELLSDAVTAANDAYKGVHKSADTIAQQVGNTFSTNRIRNFGFHQGCRQRVSGMDTPACQNACAPSTVPWGSSASGIKTFSTGQEGFRQEVCKFGCAIDELRPPTWIGAVLGYGPTVTTQGCQMFLDHTDRGFLYPIHLARVFPFPRLATPEEIDSNWLAFRARLLAGVQYLSKAMIGQVTPSTNLSVATGAWRRQSATYDVAGDWKVRPFRSGGSNQRDSVYIDRFLKPAFEQGVTDQGEQYFPQASYELLVKYQSMTDFEEADAGALSILRQMAKSSDPDEALTGDIFTNPIYGEVSVTTSVTQSVDSAGKPMTLDYKVKLPVYYAMLVSSNRPEISSDSQYDLPEGGYDPVNSIWTVDQLRLYMFQQELLDYYYPCEAGDQFCTGDVLRK